MYTNYNLCNYKLYYKYISRLNLLTADLLSNLEMLLFLKYNLRATGYRTSHLLSPPTDWVAPNQKQIRTDTDNHTANDGSGAEERETESEASGSDESD